MKCILCDEEIEEGKEKFVRLEVSEYKQPCHQECFDNAYYEAHQDKDGGL